MLYARIAGRDIPIESGSIKWEPFQAEQFTVTVPSVYLDDLADLLDETVVIYQDGYLYISGYVFDSPDLKLSSTGGTDVTLSCLSDLGRLTCYRARSDANYNGVKYTAVLQDLLQATNGEWALLDRHNAYAYVLGSPVLDPNEAFDYELTLDLRDKETLWAQLTEVIRILYPKIRVSYDGIDSILGCRVLSTSYYDDGEFNDTERLIQGENLIDIKLNRTTQKSYTLVEAYGNLEPGKTVTLEHAEASTSTITHPDYTLYPIVVEDNKYCVEDLTPGKTGCEVVVDFPEIKTTSDAGPFSASLKKAGFTLWKKTVQFIKEHDAGRTFSVVAYLKNIPVIGDRVYVQSSVREPVYDPISQQIAEYKETLSVADWLFVTKVSFDFNTAQKMDAGGSPNDIWYAYDLEVSEQQIPRSIPNELALYKKLKKKDKQKDEVYLEELGTEINVVNDTLTGIPDGSCSPLLAEYITTTTGPNPPAFTRTASMRYQVVSADTDIEVTVVELPVITGPPPTPNDVTASFCVKNSPGWAGSLAVAIIVDFIYV